MKTNKPIYSDFYNNDAIQDDFTSKEDLLDMGIDAFKTVRVSNQIELFNYQFGADNESYVEWECTSKGKS